jgi:hypothetical protein
MLAVRPLGGGRTAPSTTRLLVRDVLIGPDKITIRHRIPIRQRTTTSKQHEKTDTERASCPLRWGSPASPTRGKLIQGPSSPGQYTRHVHHDTRRRHAFPQRRRQEVSDQGVRS